MAGFKESFRAARKAGKKEFTWNGKRYNTKLASDTPSSTPTPTASPGKPRQGGPSSRAQAPKAGKNTSAGGPSVRGRVKEEEPKKKKGLIARMRMGITGKSGYGSKR